MNGSSAKHFEHFLGSTQLAAAASEPTLSTITARIRSIMSRVIETPFEQR
jgi:hypothetical protein